MGSAGDCDLLIDPADGRIIELQLQIANSLLSRSEKRTVSIPWSAVQKVGPEIIIIDMDTDLLR